SLNHDDCADSNDVSTTKFSGGCAFAIRLQELTRKVARSRGISFFIRDQLPYCMAFGAYKNKRETKPPAAAVWLRLVETWMEITLVAPGFRALVTSISNWFGRSYASRYGL